MCFLINKELISRINELHKKSKETGLTEIEKKEQEKLRAEYIKAFRSRFKQQLDNIEFTD